MKLQLWTVALVAAAILFVFAAPAQANSECAICEFIAQEVEDFVQNDHTEAEIKQLLTEACSLLPGAKSFMCKLMVKTQTSTIIKKILARETPEVICQQISLCPKEEAPVVVPETPKVGGGDLECSLCELIVGEVEKIIGENKTEANVADALDKVCDILPKALSGPCETLVNRYTPQLINLIAQDFPADVVCAKIDLCKTMSEEPHPLGGFECAACEYMASVIEQFMGNNHTESEVVDFVDKLCSFLPSALKGECDVIIETYGPVIIDYIINKEDPQTLCSQIGMCKRTASAQPPPPAPLGGLECAGCEYLMSLVESVLGNNATEQQIVQFVDQVCTLFPSALKGACEGLIDEYGPELIQFLINREDPATFCTQIGVCKKSSASAASAVGQSFLCPVCTVAISYLENYITSNSTESEIVELVEGLCNHLPSVLAMPCDVFVEQYGPHLINWLVNKEPPSEFCSSVGLCSKKVSSTNPSYVHVKRTLNTAL